MNCQKAARKKEQNKKQIKDSDINIYMWYKEFEKVFKQPPIGKP